MNNLALYVHWPFCLAKCPYCDFNSHVRPHIDQARFRAALRRELVHEAERLGRRPVASVFFGGGTPSLMEAKTVEALLGDVAKLFSLTDDVEVTLEANPTSVEAERLRDYRQAGVNRISIGVQSFDPAALAVLGRKHSTHEARQALAVARDLFPRLSFDLIYARPGQDVDAWRQELRQALAFGSDHLSLYQLTIEPNTPFERLFAHGRMQLPDDDLGSALYDVTEEECARAGLRSYEVSNYARPGGESRHNLAYWRYSDYAGIGPGAHGRITLGNEVHATFRHRVPEAWASSVEVNGQGLTQDLIVEPAERAREALLMGLRMREGIELAWFAARTGIDLCQATDATILQACLEAGYLTLSPTHLAATYEGRKRLNAILQRLAM